MKKILSSFLIFVFAVGICFSAPVAINAEAASIKDLSIECVYEVSNGKIYTRAYVQSCNKNANGEIKVPSTYEGVEVTSIGEGAFADCTKITSVVLPSTIKNIGGSAFSNCTSINTLTIPDSVTGIGGGAFSGCTSLKSIVLPQNLQKIESYLFSGCKSLENVNIPSGVTYIGEEAFYSCLSLDKFTIPEKVLEISNDAFSNTKFFNTETNWDGINLVKDNCLLALKDSVYDTLDSYTVPYGVRVIARGAFQTPDMYIKFVELPNTVVAINGAFEMSTVSEVFLPDSVLYMEGAFAQSGLYKVNIPKNVKNLDVAFQGCSSLQFVSIPEGIKTIGYSTFEKCTSLENIVLPNSIEVVDESAFLTCPKLKKVVLPQGVKKIGSLALGWIRITWNEYKKVADFTIYGVKGTAAETYAKENGFNSVLSEKLILSTPSVKIANTAKGVKVTWNAVEKAESYIVYRSTYNASTKKWSKWSAIKKGETTTSFVDGKVSLGTYYKYTVRAVNGSVMSGYKSTSGLKYNVTPTVKVANDLSGIKVSWSTAANATGYRVYRSEYNAQTKKWSGWKSRGTAKANVTSWVDKKVTSGVQYKYTVRAVNEKILSNYNKNGAGTLYLGVPTVKIANNANGIKVSWSKVAGSKGYTVYRSEYVNGTWTKWKNMGTAKNTKTSWVDKSVVSGVQYKYTARTINGNYKSTYKETSTLIYLSQPTVNVETVSNGINVSWNNVVGATGYTVYSATYNPITGKWSGWTNKNTVDSAVTSWVDASAVSGETYKYTVRAINGSCKSTYKASNELLYNSIVLPEILYTTSGSAVYHKNPECAGEGCYQIDLLTATANGLNPCENCVNKSE